MHHQGAHLSWTRRGCRSVAHAWPSGRRDPAVASPGPHPQVPRCWSPRQRPPAGPRPRRRFPGSPPASPWSGVRQRRRRGTEGQVRRWPAPPATTARVDAPRATSAATGPDPAQEIRSCVVPFLFLRVRVSSHPSGGSGPHHTQSTESEEKWSHAPRRTSPSNRAPALSAAPQSRTHPTARKPSGSKEP